MLGAAPLKKPLSCFGKIRFRRSRGFGSDDGPGKLGICALALKVASETPGTGAGTGVGLYVGIGVAVGTGVLGA
jgi:hypothetical protein